MFFELEDPAIPADLGGEVVLTESTTLPELGRVMETHRKAIREVAGTQAEQAQKIERMMGETDQLLTKVRAEQKAVWSPSGDAGLLDARYLNEDGSVRLGRTKVRGTLWDGSEGEEQEVEGLLTDPHPCTREQISAQRAFGAFRIAFGRARALRIEPNRDAFTRKAWSILGRELSKITGRVGAACRAMLADPAVLKRVISNSSTTGGELIAVPTTTDIRRPVTMERRIAGLIQTASAPAPSFKPPIITGRALAQKRGAATDDPARIPVQGFATSDTTVSVVDQAINVLLDPQWVVDAGKLFDAMGIVMDYIDQAWADTYELAILHADSTATHQDAIASWTLGSYFTAGQLDGSLAATRWWKGVRRHASDDSNTLSGGGSFDLTDHFGALNLLGVWASGSVAVTGLACLYGVLLSNSAFTSFYEMGPAATKLTGQLGVIGETPIVISQFVPKEFSTSTGLYTGSNLGNEMVYFNPRAYTHYMLDGGESWDAAYPERAARYVGETRRSVLAKTTVSGEKPAAVLYNIG